jgi:hypothetical protein
MFGTKIEIGKQQQEHEQLNADQKQNLGDGTNRNSSDETVDPTVNYSEEDIC